MSEIAIWNLALGRLGDGATVSSPNEASRQAELCRMFYPLARRSVLEMHDFNFASRRGVLAQAAENPSEEWRYAYLRPANAIRVIEVGCETQGRIKQSDYMCETLDDGTQIILSDTEEARCRFTVDVLDVGKWTPLFVEALSWYLASQLAGPIITGETGRNEARRMLQEARFVLGLSTASDANQQRDDRARRSHHPNWMAARGATNPNWRA